MSNVPAYVDMAEIAAACPETFTDTQAARRAMQREGIARKSGGRWVVGDSLLREKVPDIYDRVLEWFEQNPRNRQRPSGNVRNGQPATTNQDKGSE